MELSQERDRWCRTFFEDPNGDFLSQPDALSGVDELFRCRCHELTQAHLIAEAYMPARGIPELKPIASSSSCR
jgi:hypothetical protein